MSLIDSTYFAFDINVPASDYNNLDAYITKYEKEILMKLLGYELYKLVAAYDAGTSPQRIKDLVEGKEYTLTSGELIKWNGLKNTDKISLIAYYTYYWFVRDNSTSLEGIGNRKLTGENSEAANSGMKISAAWTKLKALYGGFGESKYVPSAYNFLSNYEGDYPEWEFDSIGSINNWDL